MTRARKSVHGQGIQQNTLTREPFLLSRSGHSRLYHAIKERFYQSGLPPFAKDLFLSSRNSVRDQNARLYVPVLKRFCSNETPSKTGKDLNKIDLVLIQGYRILYCLLNIIRGYFHIHYTSGFFVWFNSTILFQSLIFFFGNTMSFKQDSRSFTQGRKGSYQKGVLAKSLQKMVS